MGRLLRPALLATCALALAAALTLVAAVTMGGADESGSTNPPALGRGAPAAVGPGDISDPAAFITSLRGRLRDVPQDHRSWAALTSAYVEQARVTADPTYFVKADKAQARASRLAPDDPAVLTAQAALDNARHDFRAALRSANRALEANPRSGAANAYRADALTELGRYDEAKKAAVRADNLSLAPPRSPGCPTRPSCAVTSRRPPA